MVSRGLASGECMMFTIEQADKCLPTISRLVKKVQRLKNRLAWLLETHDVVLEVTNEEGFHYFVTEHVRVNREFHRLYYQFYSSIEKLNELGVILRDIDEGLVDFPFRFNSKDAFLCWQLGEDRIRHWHPVDCCFEGRKPVVDVDELLQEKDL